MRRLSFILLGILLTACESESILDQPSSLTKVQSDITVGLYPNRILSDRNSVYVVNSGDNTIGRLDLNTLQYDNSFIKMDLNTSPYSLALKDEHLFVSTSGRFDQDYNPDDAIFSFDLKTGEQKILTSSYFMVSDIIADSCLEFVESEYDFNNSTAKGKLTQYCQDQSVSIPTGCKNPARVVQSNTGYIVTCSGVYQYDQDYNITGTIGSGVCFYNEHLEETRCTLGNKDTGSPAVGERTTLIGSTFSGVITIIEDDKEETLELDKGSMLVPLHLKGDVFAIASFNTSRIFLFDATTKTTLTTFSLSNSTMDKRGPIDLVYIEDRNYLVVLNSLSSTIDILSVE